MGLVEELEGAIRLFVLEELASTGGGGELEQIDLPELLHVYGSWRARLIPAQPRRVHLARELAAQADSSPHAPALEAITELIRAGKGLTPHQSRRIVTRFQPEASSPARVSRRRDRDLLLAEWEIHHLHLSSEIEPDGFVRRTRDVLFAAFRPDDAYLIGIYGHPQDENWAGKQILETVVRNWPSAGLVMISRSGLGLTHEWDDDERLELREAGITTAIMVDGKLVAPLGQAVAGTPMRVGRHAMKVRATLDAWRPDPARELEHRLRSLDASARHAAEEGNAWRPYVSDGHFGFRKGDLVLSCGALDPTSP